MVNLWLGRAGRERTTMGSPKPLPTGRTLRIVVTSGTPRWMMCPSPWNALFWQMRHDVFGIDETPPMRVTDPVGTTTGHAMLSPGWRLRRRALGRAAT